MIEVKGSKTQAQETDPAQRYVLKDAEKKSKTPYAVGLFLTGMALYLKSIFPSLAEPEKARPAGEDEPEGAAEPTMAQAEALEFALDQQSVGTVPQGEGPKGSGGDIIRPLPPVEFMMIDSPKIEFTQPEVALFWNDFKPVSFRGRAANDNSGGGGGATGPGGKQPPVDGPDDGNTDPGGGDPNGPGGTDPTNPGDTDPGDTDPGDTDPHGTDPDGEEPPVSCDCSCEEDPDDEPCGEKEEPHANRVPRVSGPVYLRDVSGCAVLAIGLSDLLRHASDPDGDMLSVIGLTVSSGTLTRSGEGWIYEGEPRLLGPVTITYQISDGEFSVGQTAHFSVVRSFLQGSDGDDVLLGTMCADDIDGGDGDDNIDGRAGNDVIAGGCGDDHIVAGAGDDTITGGEGCDIVFAGAGNDHISGGGGDDRLFGEQGNDIVFGDAGEDFLSGGTGDDLLSGGQGDDLIEGDEGDDEIVGGSGNDHLFGGQGEDVIDGGTGRDLVRAGGGGDTILDGEGEDTVLAGAGNDRMIAALDGDDDVYEGGEDCDTLDYSATSQGVAVDLATSSAVGCEVGSDTVTDFESVLGGSGDDELEGGDGAESLYGNHGDDTLSGGAGDDALYGGAGNDLLVDGDGEDALDGGSGDDVVQAALDGDDDVYIGGEDCDTLDYSATSQGVAVDLAMSSAVGSEVGNDAVTGFESVLGGSGDDELEGGDGAESLYGNQGDDTLAGGAGNDLLADGDGEDALDGGSGDDVVRAALDGDDDVYIGGEDCDTLDYSATTQGVTVDLLSGTGSGLEIGEDAISGFEKVVGGAGNDHFLAGSAPTILTGGDGENTFEFQPDQGLAETFSVMHEILDFKVGDRIRMSKYDLFDQVYDEFQDQFEAIYGDELEAQDIPIRFSHDGADNMQRTLIEADFDDDDTYETTITLQGHHVLVIVEHT
jgi:Ca2+-binding RTX toxin-like protein